jgi:DNA-binding NarL/FixJ family response regulator
MKTIFDDMVSLSRVSDEMLKLYDTEYDPNSSLANWMVTTSGLTRHDIMLGTLLHVGFTQIEIAEFRNVKPNSVNKHVNRIVRKLDL